MLRDLRINIGVVKAKQIEIQFGKRYRGIRSSLLKTRRAKNV